MPHVAGPLRYPGGKSILSGFMADVLEENHLEGCVYIEPFAGGAGIAWPLLFQDKVSSVVLNDYDRAVYAFWHCVLRKTDQLCERVQHATFSMDEWDRQKSFQTSQGVSLEDLGFSTLFLNRVNYSGILRAGPIGGKRQNGTNRMDCRFNKKTLVEKIRKIASYRDRIKIYRQDALTFIRNKLRNDIPSKALVYLDPPYYCKGDTLYLNAFSKRKHKALKHLLGEIKQNWLMTYDCTFDINRIHADRKRRPFVLNYSANTKCKGIEMLLWDRRLKISNILPGENEI